MFFFFVQLRGDIEELNMLLQQAKQKKVQNILSLEIRKLETELVALKESEDKTTPMDIAAVPTTSAPVQNKRYQIKLNGYGKFPIISVNMCFLCLSM